MHDAIPVLWAMYLYTCTQAKEARRWFRITHLIAWCVPAIGMLSVMLGCWTLRGGIFGILATSFGLFYLIPGMLGLLRLRRAKMSRIWRHVMVNRRNDLAFAKRASSFTRV